MSSIENLIRVATERGLIEDCDLLPAHMAYISASKNDSGAINLLARMVIATMPTGVHQVRGVEKLVRIELGQHIGMAAVRTDLRCKIPKCEEYRAAAKSLMAGIRSELSEKLHQALRLA